MTDDELTPNLAALGRAVRAIRDERGINQVELAAKTSFTQAWISHVERGKRNPSWNNIVRLAAGLGVGVAELAARAEMLVTRT
ncbi:MAG TPA: helix-turn-helix transcriptional regulator [Solirubrobacteraceae bacterium]|jgi:transcriptional regulator with XRE-family HTH domain|nr:helix-turn-helix transcriptional regulator [Solirubrobacteraceae bacterium]